MTADECREEAKYYQAAANRAGELTAISADAALLASAVFELAAQVADLKSLLEKSA